MGDVAAADILAKTDSGNSTPFEDVFSFEGRSAFSLHGSERDEADEIFDESAGKSCLIFPMVGWGFPGASGSLTDLTFSSTSGALVFGSGKLVGGWALECLASLGSRDALAARNCSALTFNNESTRSFLSTTAAGLGGRASTSAPV